MTDTPAFEAAVAAFAGDSAPAESSSAAPTDVTEPPEARSPDAPEPERRLVIAAAHGEFDVEEWIAAAQRVGVTVMRLTDVVDGDLDDLRDPESAYGRMDDRARAAVEAGLGVVLDLSFVRDAALKSGENPYDEAFDWESLLEPLLGREFPTGGTYGTSEHVVYVALPGEPRMERDGGPEDRTAGAEEAEDLIAFYQRLARLVRRAAVDRPLAAAGFVDHGEDGNGTDAGLDITAVYSLLEIDVCTTHAADEESLDALHMLTRYVHALGKPIILEETGRDIAELTEEEGAAWLDRVRQACEDTGVDGVGVWEVTHGGGFDIDPPTHRLAAVELRRMADVVVDTGAIRMLTETHSGDSTDSANSADSTDSADSARSAGSADSVGHTDSSDAEGAESAESPSETFRVSGDAKPSTTAAGWIDFSASRTSSASQASPPSPASPVTAVSPASPASSASVSASSPLTASSGGSPATAVSDVSRISAWGSAGLPGDAGATVTGVPTASGIVGDVPAADTDHEDSPAPVHGAHVLITAVPGYDAGTDSGADGDAPVAGGYVFDLDDPDATRPNGIALITGVGVSGTRKVTGSDEAAIWESTMSPEEDSSAQDH